MRIAAGVILIVVSVISVIFGAGIAFIGAAGELASSGMSDLMKEAAADSNIKIDTANMATADAMLTEVGAGSGMVKYYGFLLLVLFVLQLVAGIMAFVKKGAMFLFITAGLTLVAAVWTFMLPFPLNSMFYAITALLAAVFAVLAAMEIKKLAGQPAA